MMADKLDDEFNEMIEYGGEKIPVIFAGAMGTIVLGMAPIIHAFTGLDPWDTIKSYKSVALKWIKLLHEQEREDLATGKIAHAVLGQWSKGKHDLWYRNIHGVSPN